jgi:hypothetical protein
LFNLEHNKTRKLFTTLSGSKFSNIVAILTVNILKNRNIASIFFKNRNKTSGFFTVGKYIKYSVYHVTDLANEIVRKPQHM